MCFVDKLGRQVYLTFKRPSLFCEMEFCSEKACVGILDSGRYSYSLCEECTQSLIMDRELVPDEL